MRAKGCVMAEVKLLQFNFLPKLSKAQALLINLCIQKLHELPKEQDTSLMIQNTLQELTQQRISTSLRQVEVVPTAALVNIILRPTCIFVFQLFPSSELAIAEFNINVVRKIAYKLIGTKAPADDANSPLSDIEQGIASFVILKLIDAVQKDTVFTFLKTVKLVAISNELAFSPPTDQSPRTTIFSFDFSLDGQASSARIFLPSSVFEKASPVLQNEENDIKQVTTALQRASGVKATLVAEVGRLTLHPDDFNALEVDDIIVIEGPHVKMQNSQLAGNVVCTLDQGGNIPGALALSADGKYCVKIQASLPAPDPTSLPLKGNE